MDLSKYIDWIKLKPRYLIPISLVSGFLIFSPDSCLDIFALNEFVNHSRPWIGIIFLLSAVLTLSSLFIYIGSKTSSMISSISKQKQMYYRLNNLTPDEKVILRGYIKENTRSQNFQFDDGRLEELIENRIIYQSSTFVSPGYTLSYNINPKALNYLQKNKNLIYTSEDIDFIGSSKA